MEEKSKRRWLSFSVRTLLIAVTIFCVSLGWAIQRAKKGKEAREWLYAHYGFLSDHPEYAPPEHRLAPWGLGLVGEGRCRRLPCKAADSNERTNTVRSADA
jgi:hypothetical protein